MKPASHRIATWWIHWEDLNWPDGDNLDKIKARAQRYAEAGVSAAMLFGTHFRWDFLPYFTQLHDYIATVAEQLHGCGVKLFDHHSVSLIHRYDTVEEMRHVVLDSGPHLPFCPSREAAKTWEYRGRRLNDWRMIDVRDGKPLYLPQYTAEGFCHRNPEFRQAYKDYVRELISVTGIDGLSADDAIYYMHLNACGCPHCREEFRKRTGLELPPADDAGFWGNWDNPAWQQWIDLRSDAAGDFYADLRTVLPGDFVLTGCGANSAAPIGVMAGSDARSFLRGWNYVNMEMSGNTPPYKHDPLTTNRSVPVRLVNASHHQAAAREQGVRAFCTGFAHSTENANHVWATSKLLGADAWIGTLKMRLGLPRHILNTLPNEEDITGTAFGFEKTHPELFSGESVGQLGVYYSYETRNHTLYGSLEKGYYRDYGRTLTLLFREGLSPHTVFSFPEDPADYPVILIPGAARLAPEELSAMERYLNAGGKVVAMGPTNIPGCEHSWQLPNRVEPGDTVFTTVPDGIHAKRPAWIQNREVPEPVHDRDWQMPRPGLYYNSRRPEEGVEASLLELVRRFVKPLPVEILKSRGYLFSFSRCEGGTVVQALAADYDVDINHELDSIRTHRSRVNLLTKIEAIGVDREIRLAATKTPVIYTPFNGEGTAVTGENGTCTVTLPEKCSYALLFFPGEKAE